MNRWCVASGAPRGAVLTLDQTWGLAQAWYGDRMDPAFRGRTVAEATDIFARLGLTGEFWQAGGAS